MWFNALPVRTRRRPGQVEMPQPQIRQSCHNPRSGRYATVPGLVEMHCPRSGRTSINLPFVRFPDSISGEQRLNSALNWDTPHQQCLCYTIGRCVFHALSLSLSLSPSPSHPPLPLSHTHLLSLACILAECEKALAQIITLDDLAGSGYKITGRHRIHCLTGGSAFGFQHLHSNHGLATSEWCFIFRLTPLPLDVAEPIQPTTYAKVVTFSKIASLSRGWISTDLGSILILDVTCFHKQSVFCPKQDNKYIYIYIYMDGRTCIQKCIHRIDTYIQTDTQTDKQRQKYFPFFTDVKPVHGPVTSVVGQSGHK